jgi:hypothetical protein
VGVPVEHADVVAASDAMAGAVGAVIERVLAEGDGWTAT